MKIQTVVAISILGSMLYASQEQDAPKPEPIVKSCQAEPGPESYCTVSASRDNKFTSCTAWDGAKCIITLNAIGDLATFKVEGTPINLGTIRKAEKFTLRLPTKEGQTVTYGFTPSTGESVGKLIYVLFYKAKPRIGTLYYGKTVIKIYRKFSYEKDTAWVEVGQLVSSLPVENLRKGYAVLRPDGTALIPGFIKGEAPVVVSLGRLKIRKN